MAFTIPLVLLAVLAPAASDDRAEAELEKLCGTWEVVSMTKNGNAFPERSIKGRVAVIVGGKFTDKQGEKVFGAGTIRIDPEQSPKAIDSTFTEGPIQGKTAPGIYEIDGDTLKSCVAEPGDERPKAFESKRGSGHMLVVYRRAKAKL